MQMKRKRSIALGTFLLCNISIPHVPVRRQAKVVWPGLGIPAVEGDEVHERCSSWDRARSVSRQGPRLLTGMDLIKGKKDVCF